MNNSEWNINDNNVLIIRDKSVVISKISMIEEKTPWFGILFGLLSLVLLIAMGFAFYDGNPKEGFARLLFFLLFGYITENSYQLRILSYGKTYKFNAFLPSTQEDLKRLASVLKNRIGS